ncbi:MAG: GNAT family N-acetyltransferase [Symbiobacteriaceae bacterium]|nr:GNAT family N-acetyltransferase [Symbiobacteriaceae bacterium]
MKGTTIPPLLQSHRLILRSVRQSDLPQVHLVRSDPDIARLMGFTPHTKMERSRIYLQSMLNGMDAGEWLFWALTLPGQDRYLGSIVLWNYQVERNEAELGYSLLPEHQRRGYMSEALPVVMDYAYTDLQIDTLHAFTGRGNLPSRFLLEKLNFLYCADVGEEMPNGQIMELADYVMTKEDFYARETS